MQVFLADTPGCEPCCSACAHLFCMQPPAAGSAARGSKWPALWATLAAKHTKARCKFAAGVVCAASGCPHDGPSAHRGPPPAHSTGAGQPRGSLEVSPSVAQGKGGHGCAVNLCRRSRSRPPSQHVFFCCGGEWSRLFVYPSSYVGAGPWSFVWNRWIGAGSWVHAVDKLGIAAYSSA